MNDVFREMAEQMRPSPQLVADVERRLDEMDELAKPRPVVERAAAPARSRRRAVKWLAAAACLAAVASTGVWAIGNQPMGGSANSAPAAAPAGGVADLAPAGALEPSVEASVVPVKQYGELYQAVAKAMEAWQANHVYTSTASDSVVDYGSAVTSARVPGPPPAPMDVQKTRVLSGQRTTASLESSEYSQTNVQVVGIDEGDIVKTDGRALYVASGSRVAILAPDGSSTRALASIDTAAGDAPVAGAVLDMMLSGDTLVVFVQDYAVNSKTIGGNESTAYVPYDVTGTRALLYDVSDPASPKRVASMGQSGTYTTSRLSGGVLYLVTDYALTDPGKIEKDDPATFAPQLIDDTSRAPLDPHDIHALTNPRQPRYAVVSAVDVATGKRLGQQSVLAGADTTYMSQDNLYLAATLSDVKLSAAQRKASGVGALVNNAVTTIVRIGLNGGALSLGAQDNVPGTLLNQFALDEHEGHLRVVTDMSERERVGLFVLNSKLAIVGRIPNLVENETVQSVRFEGRVGYVVTFRQRDPLFAIDLSKPKKPTVMSALKIPGFSAYLHPWADGRLLGIGVDARDDGSQTGLKLSMFDTHDPYAVTQLTSKHVAGGDSEALGDHKAVLIDTARGLIGFPVVTWSDSGEPTQRYAVYAYTAGKGFTLRKDLKMVASDATRGVLVGDYLYLCTAKQIDVYPLDSLTRAARVTVAQD